MNSFPDAAADSLRRRLAFTLVELLVTMVVGALLITFLFQLFNATSGAWRSGEDQADTYREARAALQMMARDISATSAPMFRNPYPPSTPAASPTPTPGVAPVLVLDRYNTAPNIVQDPPSQGGDEINEELYCLTNIPNSGASTLCAVGYFCMWMPDLISPSDPQSAQRTSSAPQAYALVRQFLGSGSTASPGLFERFKAAGTPPLMFKDIFERARPPQVPSPMPSPPVATGTQLASYIWDLQFRTPTSLQTQRWPMPDQTYPQVVAYPNMPLTTGGYPSTLPAYVEIRFKALSARAARRLEGNTGILRTTWNDSNVNNPLYKSVILPGTRQFVARVSIGNGNANTTP